MLCEAAVGFTVVCVRVCVTVLVCLSVQEKTENVLIRNQRNLVGHVLC